MTPEDFKWLSQSTHWVGEKHDGVMVKLINSKHCLEIHGSDGRARKFVGYTSPYDGEFILQAEMVAKDGAVAFIVVDVLLAPWGAKGNFLSRWHWLEMEYLHKSEWSGDKRVSKYPFTLQRWFALYDPRLPKMIAQASEGIVLQPVIAGYGAITRNMGSALYVKRVPTIDVFRDGSICEVTLDGKFVRFRPDKNRPNPPAVIENIKRACTLNEFIVFLNKFMFDYDGPSAALLDKMTRWVPVADWTHEELMDFHRTCLTPFMEQQWGRQLFTWRVMVHSRMAKEAEAIQASLDLSEVVSLDLDFSKYDRQLTEYIEDTDNMFAAETMYDAPNVERPAAISSAAKIAAIPRKLRKGRK